MTPTASPNSLHTFLKHLISPLRAGLTHPVCILPHSFWPSGSCPHTVSTSHTEHLIMPSPLVLFCCSAEIQTLNRVFKTHHAWTWRLPQLYLMLLSLSPSPIQFICLFILWSYPAFTQLTQASTFCSLWWSAPMPHFSHQVFEQITLIYPMLFLFKLALITTLLHLNQIPLSLHIA